MIYAAVDMNCLFVGGLGRAAAEQPGASTSRTDQGHQEGSGQLHLTEDDHA